MAKLSERQKDNIRALFNTGNYSKNKIAKKYKVDEKTVRRIIGSQQPKHKDLVEEAVKIEVRKQAELLPNERRAVEAVVKEKTSQERMKEIVLDNVLKVSVHTTTASAKLLQDNASSKNKMDGNELLTLQKVAKEAKATVVEKEDKTVVENNLNMQQMVLSQQETNVDVNVVDLDAEELLKLFKDRNLPQ